MLIFIAILLRSYEDARQGCCKSTLIKTAARQGCCKTRKAFVRLTTELALTHFTRKCRITVQRPCALLHGCHKNHTNRMTTHEVRTTVLPPYLLQAHQATALRVNARQACEHRTDALRLLKIYMRYAILSWQNGRTIDVKQALSTID